jgi:hypothetical protein
VPPVDRRGLEQTLRNWGPRSAIVIAIVACLQVGYIRYEQGEHTASLERQLADLERQNRQAIAQLSSQLAGTRARMQQLRAELAQSDVANGSLQEQLRTASESAQSLQTRVSELAETLRDEPPFLEIRLEPTVPMEGLVAIAENRGNHPVQIAESRGLVWVGGLLGDAGDVLDVVTVEPGHQSDFFEIRLIGDEPRLVTEQGVDLRGALCLVYERSLEEGAQPWTGEYWFEYQPGSRSVEFVGQSSWPLTDGEIPCQLEIAELPW